jgi:putative NIF3 family GTP cyclohydrolase 1 type 2
MPTIDDIILYAAGLSGHPLNPDEGIHHGPAQRSVAGVTLCWMATPGAIADAGRRGHELIIGHESLYYPYNVVINPEKPDGWEQWQTNRQRREALERNGLTFLRLHFTLDEISIFDDFTALLGLGEPVVADGLVKVYEIEPRPLRALTEDVKARLDMPRVRVSAPNGLDQSVHRVGLPWGGLGLFVNVDYQQRLIEQACDVFIAGEADDYGFRFSEECGIPMIETSHEISENPGLRRFATMLALKFPDLDVHFYENTCPWQIL